MLNVYIRGEQIYEISSKKIKKVHLNDRKDMYCLLNYNCSHENRISHDFIYYRENSKNSDFIHKLIHSLIMYLLVKSSLFPYFFQHHVITAPTHFR